MSIYKAVAIASAIMLSLWILGAILSLLSTYSPIGLIVFVTILVTGILAFLIHLTNN